MRGLSLVKCLGRGLALNLLRDTSEYLWLLSGKCCKNLSIELDARLRLRCNKGAVGLVAEVADSSVQTYDPELTEISLLVATVIERVLTGVHQGLLREAHLGGTSMTKSLGPRQYVAATFR